MSRRLALALLLTVALGAAPAQAAHVQSVRVGFGKPLATANLVGFVHGMDPRRPGDEMIEPLAPALWRGKLRDVPYRRVQEVGGRYTYVLSDRWGYPGEGRPPPYEDFAAWERFVRDVARAARKPDDLVLGEDLVFDVWNEPDEAYFWQGTPEQFYETYRIAENVLRRELGPDVVVGGPSTLGWQRDWLSGLLECCRVRGCQVNALSWHELSGGSIPALEDRVEDARETMLESSRYRALRIREIHVNESLAAADQYRPGELLGVMHYLEAGGADAAARACWNDLSGQSNCYNDTLAGLLVPGSFEPRSAWWATKAYADGAGSRVLTRFSAPHVVGLGSSRSDEPRSAQLLIAHLRGHSRRDVDVKVTFRKLGRLGFLRGERRLRVEIERFPDSGELPLAKPRGRRTAVLRISDGEARLTLHDVRRHEAYRPRLTEP
jgi:xylan 1,4-beta-xylosidase